MSGTHCRKRYQDQLGHRQCRQQRPQKKRKVREETHMDVGDQSMLSTPSTQGDEGYEEEDDSLFPDVDDHGAANSNNNIGVNSTSIPRARIPQNDHLNAAAPGELSPPRSHSNNHNNMVNNGGNGDDEDDDDDDDDDEVIRRRGQAAAGMIGGGGVMGTGMDLSTTEDLSPAAANRTMTSSTAAATAAVTAGGVEEWKPGQGWKSKKAQEDMQRAWENIIDRDFSLKEYGDVMAHHLGV